tara:strand:+ start:100678 stop:100926 length:249 start_codon:yes stop_codon:yes gene_type:complete
MFDFTLADNGSDLLLTCDVFIEVAPVLMSLFHKGSRHAEYKEKTITCYMAQPFSAASLSDDERDQSLLTCEPAACTQINAPK